MTRAEEAAKEYAYSWRKEGNKEVRELFPTTACRAFIAGAEWMTKQGQSKEGIVCDNNEFIKFPDGSYIDLRPDLDKMAFDVKDGDEVIVQIRKK